MRVWLIADQILIYLQGFGDHLASNNRPVIGNMFKQVSWKCPVFGLYACYHILLMAFVRMFCFHNNQVYLTNIAGYRHEHTNLSSKI